MNNFLELPDAGLGGGEVYDLSRVRVVRFFPACPKTDDSALAIGPLDPDSLLICQKSIVIF